MNQHIILLILIAMAAALSSQLWAMSPEDQLKQGQKLRIEKVATLSFH